MAHLGPIAKFRKNWIPRTILRLASKTNSSPLVTPWKISLVAAVLAEVASLALIPSGFITIDDVIVEAVLSGAMASDPSPLISFVNYFLCSAISCLYGFVPQVPWWSILHIVILLLSFTGISWAISVTLRSYGKVYTWWHELIASVVVCVGMFACAASYLQFTVTAVMSFVSASMVSAVAVLPDVRDGKRRCGVCMYLVVCAVLGCAMRWQSGALGFLFWGISILGMFLLQHGDFRIRVSKIAVPLIAFAAAAALSLLLFVGHRVAWSTPELSECYDSLVAYAAYTDQPQLPYEEGEELYKSLGWDEDLFYLSRYHWFNMDERINLETLTPFTTLDHNKLGRFLSDPMGYLEINLNSMRYPYMLSAFSAFAVMAIGACAYARTKNERLSVVLVISAAFILMGKLVLDGRTPERAMLAILLPAIGSIAALVFGRLALGGCERGKRGLSISTMVLVLLFGSAMALLGYWAGGFGKAVVLFGCLCIALILFTAHGKASALATARNWVNVAMLVCSLGVVCLPTIGAIRDYGWNSEAHQVDVARQEHADTYYDYALAHPDMIFIAEPNLPTALPSPFGFRWAKNCTMWGGWRTYYPWYEDAMKQLGLPGVPTTDTFFLDNVRLVLSSERLEQIFPQYLSGLYGPVELQLDTVLSGDIRIYKVVRVEEE